MTKSDHKKQSQPYKRERQLIMQISHARIHSAATPPYI